MPGVSIGTQPVYGLPSSILLPRRPISSPGVASRYLNTIYGIIGVNRLIYPKIGTTVYIYVAGSWAGLINYGIYSPDGTINLYLSQGSVFPEGLSFSPPDTASIVGVMPYAYPVSSIGTNPAPSGYVLWTPAPGQPQTAF